MPKVVVVIEWEENEKFGRIDSVEVTEATIKLALEHIYPRNEFEVKEISRES